MHRSLKIAIAIVAIIGASNQAMASDASSAAMNGLSADNVGSPQAALLNQSQPQIVWTTTRYATQGHPDRFVFHVATRGPVTLQSESLASAQNPSYQLSADVLNEQGQVVAHSDGTAQGNFRIQQQLEPGTYVLQVNGTAMQSATQADNSYQVTAAL